MRNQASIWGALLLTVCTGRASAQEEDRVAKTFERLGAVVKRDNTKRNWPVIAVRFGLRNPIPDETPESVKDVILDCIGCYARFGTPAIVRVRPTATDDPSGPATKVTDEHRKDGVQPLDPSTPTAIKVTDEDLKDLSKLVNLETLDLSCGEITNKALEHIKGLKNLQTLDLRNTQVSDAGLAMLKELKSLKQLYLTNCPVTDDGLVHLRGLNLEALYVGGLLDKVTDKGVRHLKELKNLQKLYVPHALGLTDDGLKELKELTNLRELNLCNTKLTGEGLRHLSRLERLEILDLDGNHLTDDALKHLTGLQRLEVLNLGDNQVTDAGLEHLSGLKGLRLLDLRRNQVTDKGIKALLELESLRRLSVAYTKVTDKGLKQLKELRKLERLDLRETQVSGAGQNEIKEALPKLEIGEIPELPDWYKRYLDQQVQRQFPSLPPIPVFKELNGWTRGHEEPARPAGAYTNDPHANDKVVIGCLIIGLLLGGFVIIHVLVQFWKTEKEKTLGWKVLLMVGKVLGYMVLVALCLLIAVPFVLIKVLMEYYLFGH
jgi:Leucine-rich repeat (LRR) protein